MVTSSNDRPYNQFRIMLDGLSRLIFLSSSFLLIRLSGLS